MHTNIFGSFIRGSFSQGFGGLDHVYAPFILLKKCTRHFNVERGDRIYFRSPKKLCSTPYAFSTTTTATPLFMHPYAGHSFTFSTLSLDILASWCGFTATGLWFTCSRTTPPLPQAFVVYPSLLRDIKAPGSPLNTPRRRMVRLYFCIIMSMRFGVAGPVQFPWARRLSFIYAVCFWLSPLHPPLWPLFFLGHRWEATDI